MLDREDSVVVGLGVRWVHVLPYGEATVIVCRWFLLAGGWFGGWWLAGLLQEDLDFPPLCASREVDFGRASRMYLKSFRPLTKISSGGFVRL